MQSYFKRILRPGPIRLGTLWTLGYFLCIALVHVNDHLTYLYDFTNLIAVSSAAFLVVFIGGILVNACLAPRQSRSPIVILLSIWIIYMWIVTTLFSRHGYSLETLSRAWAFQSAQLLAVVAYYQIGARFGNTHLRMNRALFTCLFVITTCFLITRISAARYGLGIQATAYVSCIYFQVLLLPWFLSPKSPRFRTLAIITVIVTCLYSFKRGAIIGAVTATGAYYLGLIFLKKRSIRSVVGIAASILVLFGAIQTYRTVAPDVFERVVLRFSQTTYDGGSGRTDIWRTLIDKHVASPVFRQIFGWGYYGVFERMQVFAHNDFVESLFSFGIVGLLAFVSFTVALAIHLLVMMRKKSHQSPGMLAAFCLFFLMAMGSYNTYFLGWSPALFAFIGYTLGIEKHSRTQRPIAPILLQQLNSESTCSHT